MGRAIKLAVNHRSEQKMPRKTDTAIELDSVNLSTATDRKPRNPIGPPMNGADFLRIVRAMQRPYFGQNVLAQNPEFSAHHYSTDEVRNIRDAVALLTSVDDPDASDARAMVIDAAETAFTDAQSRADDADVDEIDERKQKRATWLAEQPAFIAALRAWFSRYDGGARQPSSLAFVAKGAIACCDQRLRNVG